MLIGRNVSHYRVLEQIGRGGMGEVLLAEDSILGRRVALKFLTAAGDSQERNRILAEARAAASIDHPCVCKIFETCESEGRCFIVMEFVEGETLAKSLLSGPIPYAKALAIMTEIAEALAEAHGKGMVHCDLKPSNIMIARSGHVKLMDFGLARQFRPLRLGPDDETLAVVSLAGGTIAYMSPEQAIGEPADAPVDVFAFGIVLYEVLTGAHPFKKSTPAATFAAILREEPPKIEQYLPGAHPALGQILKRALAKQAKERYASAEELVPDLIALRDNGRGLSLASASNPAPPVIAILPFKDMSQHGDQEYFCDGLAEELIVVLGTLDQLKVVSRSAAFRYRAGDLSLQEIGQALGATTLLEGSVRKAGDRLRIVVNLVDIENGCPVWSQRYDRQLDDIFEIQDEISRAVAEKLKVTFAAPPAAAQFPGTTQNIRAYEFYLRGRHFWNKRSEQNLKLSIDQFQRAIDEDPQYAHAYAGLADAWVTLAVYGAIRPSDAIPLARAAADRALALDPLLPEALAARACIAAIFDWNWNSAEREFEFLIRQHPRFARARQWFAMNCLAPRGLYARAAEELRIAAELEPVSLAISSSVALLDLFDGKYDDAIARLRSVLELDDSFYLAHYFLGQAYSEVRLHEDAIRELERAAAMSGRSSESLAALGCAQASAGRRDESLAILRELTERQATAYVSAVLIAQVQTGLQQFEDAAANLQRAFSDRSVDLVWLGVRPAFQSIGSHERVAAILNRVGLRTLSGIAAAS